MDAIKVDSADKTAASDADLLPLISVVIPTYGREAVLCDSIKSVLAQTYPAFELIVVDQTQQHEAETQAFLDEMAAAAKIQLHRVSWASLPGARNYAIERASTLLIESHSTASRP
ncbi:MAG: glycosyltransferase [Cyanobacteria bacterium J06629_19]